MLRRHVDRRVLLGFGIASAAGGLARALVHTVVSSRALAVVFGSLLKSAEIVAAFAEKLTASHRAIRAIMRIEVNTRESRK